MKATVWITEAAMDTAREMLEGWAKRARKLGLAEPTLTPTGATRVSTMTRPKGLKVIGHDSVTVDDSGRKVTYREAEVVVEADEPVLSGWSLAAVVDHTVSDAAAFITTRPGVTVDTTQYRHAEATTCDHCGYTRQRNRTYVIRHEDGREMRVGSTCIKDFLPGPMDAEKLFDYLGRILGFLRDPTAALGGDDDGFDRGGERWLGYEMMDYVTEVAAEIRAHGWLSRGAAWDAYANVGMATASQAADNLWMRTRGNRDQRARVNEEVPVADDDRAAAEAALAWARDLPVDAGDDYLDNLAVACRSDYVTPKTMGIVASVVQAHGRAVAEDVRRKRIARESRDSQHVGAVGDRLDLVLTVTFTRIFDGTYGERQLTKMVDADGNVFVWWATSEFLSTGDTWAIRGTVKGHDTYQGVAQTTLTRCSVGDRVDIGTED